MDMVMTVGEWVLSNVVDKVVDKVSLYLEDQYDQFTGDKTMVEDVKARLPRIRAVIQAAEGRPIRDPALATWLRELKDAAYEADDILDELEYNNLHHQLSNKRKASDYLSSAFKFLRHFTMSDDDPIKKLKNLGGNFDKIYTNINYIEEQLKDYNSKQSSVTRETSSIIQDIVLGRERERDMILEVLLPSANEPESSIKCGTGSSSYPCLGVLPIVGIGGVGKTALAQLIYNDERVVSHFEVRKWVYVSDNFDVKRISKELAYDSVYTPMWDNISLDRLKETVFTRDKLSLDDILGLRRLTDTMAYGRTWDNVNSLDLILGRLKDTTRNKRFIFVLDDVWDETGSKWEKLRSALTSGAKGSMVLVTTQSPVVATVLGTMAPIELNCLQEDDYWELFEHCAFGDQILEEERRKNLQAIGRQISQKLHGLPLAAKVLGSLLKTKLDEDHWKRILESEWWEDEYVLNNILPSLALSYEHLDANLKQCFAYCSIFPRSYIFEKDRLIQMWMAQGFIQNKNPIRMRMEDIGGQIFDKLTSRYFFLPTMNDKYVMHDLIRELAVCVSMDECLVISDERGEIPETIRHLTLRTDKMDAIMDTCKFQNLRSLLFFGEYDSAKFYYFLEGMLKQSKSLRVLDLSYSHVKVKKLPDAIGGLLHLRYLDVSRTKIEQLPKSICWLCHLQVLNMRSCHIQWLPEDTNKLINLRHLYGDGDAISLITGIGDLTNLQELEEFQVTKEQRHGIGELENLGNLRGRLCIKNLEHVESKEEAMMAMLKDKEHLTTLHLEWKDGAGSLQIFEGLQPHPSLEELEIKGFGGLIFPTWIVENKFLTNLKSISLESCRWLKSVPQLGQLPFLKYLYFASMHYIKRIGPEFYGDTGVAFPSLKVLKFANFGRWEEWLEADGTQFLPRLHTLHLHTCPSLRKVPLLFLSSSLVEINIQDCSDFGGSALPTCLQRLTSLTNLTISHYHSQEFLCLSNLRAIEHLHIVNCRRVKLVGGLQFLGTLKHLHIEDCAGVKLVGGLQFLSTLETLELAKCPMLIDSSEPVQLHEGQGLRTLYRLRMDDTILLQNLRILLGRLPSLQYLLIHSSHRITNFTEEHELWFLQLTSLQELEINDCQNLESLPTSLVNFSTIRRLTIRNCPHIRSLPENELPTSLEELRIMGCPLLKDRCQRGGADWPKIAHIPIIRIV